jgi:predicted DNA-binding transcriptional regulator YafY
MSDIELISRLLFEKYKKVTLDAQEAAEALGISVKTLNADRAEAIGIPYTRVNNKAGGKVLYTINEIAKTLVKNQVKTA